ncbi:hypothetical protein CAEBREN_08252 [Caenorhabditis brenneri]|uniref:Uncharacterized protein n=1 Tax=Caenorhabditis brenneri TaxID=135651 RepID=G0N3N8_CAEBE|nr:hypothetical protein CAEBREN_08252 [Caenorhabditis brenneri]
MDVPIQQRVYQYFLDL